MKKRAFWLLLALLATQSIGCWWWHRPYPFRPWLWNDHCCATSHDCCAAPAAVEYGAPLPQNNPANPAMPAATPLTKR
jgi:hypothetical protein